MFFKLAIFMKKSEYNTKQRELILDNIKKRTDFTIKDLEISLPEVGQTTIYREINKLLKSGELIKIIKNNSNTHYQYINKCNCDHHIYLKCTICGEMTHIDCEFINDIKKHIKLDHNFKMNTDNLIFNGICQKCCNKEESTE